MSGNTDLRYVGLVADGNTDKEILAKVVTCLFENDERCHVLSLRQSFRDCVDQFTQMSSKSGNYCLSGRPATELRKKILRILFAALRDFENLCKRDLFHRDLMVLNTDAEFYLVHSDRYFSERWALCLTSSFLKAAEEFYHHQSNRYRWTNLPMILPLVFFPSIDVLVAAAKTRHDQSFSYRGLRARVIKKNLYGTEDLRDLQREQLEDVALRYITRDSVRSAYELLPEFRTFFRTMAWSAACNIS